MTGQRISRGGAPPSPRLRRTGENAEGEKAFFTAKYAKYPKKNFALLAGIPLVFQAFRVVRVVRGDSFSVSFG